MSDKWHGGKGDKPRKSFDRSAYAENYDRIFRKKNADESKDKQPKGNLEIDDQQGRSEPKKG